MEIYLSSGMAKFGKENFKEGEQWRIDLTKKLGDEYKYFDPNEYYSFLDDDVNEKEAMEYDLYRLRNSDLLVYCATDPKSLGSMAEIAIAHENLMPILVLNENNEELHTWIKYMSFKEFNNMDEMIDFIDYYFNPY